MKTLSVQVLGTERALSKGINVLHSGGHKYLFHTGLWPWTSGADHAVGSGQGWYAQPNREGRGGRLE